MKAYKKLTIVELDIGKLHGMWGISPSQSTVWRPHETTGMPCLQVLERVTTNGSAGIYAATAAKNPRLIGYEGSLVEMWCSGTILEGETGIIRAQKALVTGIVTKARPQARDIRAIVEMFKPGVSRLAVQESMRKRYPVVEDLIRLYGSSRTPAVYQELLDAFGNEDALLNENDIDFFFQVVCDLNYLRAGDAGYRMLSMQDCPVKHLVGYLTNTGCLDIDLYVQLYKKIPYYRYNGGFGEVEAMNLLKAFPHKADLFTKILEV